MSKKSVIVLIGGGHSAGKHTVCKEIEATLTEVPNLQTHTIELDTLTVADCSVPFGASRFDFARVLEQISSLESANESDNLMILIPGLYALYSRELRQMATMKVFVDCDADTRLNRWIAQDVLQDGKELGALLDNYLKIARPEFTEFIMPTKEFADVVLPSEESRLGITLICDGLAPALGVGHAENTPKIGLFPRVAEKEMDLQGERYDAEKNRYYDLS